MGYEILTEVKKYFDAGLLVRNMCHNIKTNIDSKGALKYTKNYNF
jgi:hypothetical protein